MRKHLIISILLLNLIVTAHAQDNYSPGYIITNEQDTIFGLVDYRTDKMNALTCHFKKDQSNEIQTYLPGQIFGYRFTDAGKFYVSKFITINGIQQKVFLEFLLQGIMNLYYFCDESNADYLNYYFFENENGEMVSITKHPDKIIKEDNGIMRKLEDNKYQRIVDYIFKDCSSLKYKALHANFTHKDMIGLTKDYHNLVCTSGAECIEFETTPDKHYFKKEFTVYGGYENHGLAPKAVWDYYNSESYIDVNNSPLMGLQINISAPRWKKSLSLIVDFSLTKHHNDQNKSYPKYSFQYSKAFYWNHVDYSYDALRLGTNIGANYTYNKGKLRPSIEVGLIFDSEFVIKEKLSASFLNIRNSQVYYDNWEKKNNLVPCFMPGHYAAVGFDYDLGNNHSAFFRINNEVWHNFFWFRENTDMTWKFRLGYTF